jgi:hypothetical protein
MNRSNVERKQGDSRDLDRQYQSSARKPWPAEFDRGAFRRHSNASAVHSTTSSTAANEEIHEPRIKSPMRTVSGSRDARCLTRGMLPPPCPPQEPSFAFLDSTETVPTGACLTDHTISTVESIMLDQDKSAEYQKISLTPGQWLRWRGADEMPFNMTTTSHVFVSIVVAMYFACPTHGSYCVRTATVLVRYSTMMHPSRRVSKVESDWDLR